MLSFGHEGTLYERSFVMYDKQTETLWVHTTGEAIKGPLKGKVLEFLPSAITTWKRWKARHPKTVVLTGKRGRPRMGHYGIREALGQYGYSVGQGKQPKLYEAVPMKAARLVNDTLDRKPIVVFVDADGTTARAYERGDRTFAWKDGGVVDQDGVAWDLARGVSKSASPKRLREIPATAWLIERWHAHHREGVVYKAKEPEPASTPGR